MSTHGATARALFVRAPRTSQELTRAVSIFDRPVVAFFGRTTVPGACALNEPGRESAALVRVRAFSCNYRDKAIALAACAAAPGTGVPIGSEFAGIVVACGSRVTRVHAGDRVIGQYHYTGASPFASGAPEGVPTNAASLEYLMLDERQLETMPATMDYDVGAAFAVTAQTGYGMLGRLPLAAGQRALLTAGTSNTSLFLIRPLLDRGISVSVTTGSPRHVGRLLERGVDDVYVDVLRADSDDRARLAAAVRQRPFDIVIDPFADRYLGLAVRVLRAGGHYATCGLLDQGPTAPDVGYDLRFVLATAIRKNLTLHANCLGTAERLGAAIADWNAGRADVPIDGVFSDGDAPAFLHRTFVDPERLGKVVYRYDD